MSQDNQALTTRQALARVEAAAAAGDLSRGAVENLRKWLSESRYAAYTPAVVADIAARKWQQLDDVFWTVIPFGTGGRRGRMYPIGSNAINDRTIGESAQGLADYVKDQHDEATLLSCAIAYDTRHKSRHFAELCAGIMVAAGFKVFFLEDYRSTPELSYLVRYKHCSCGIMVTASHNPPSDNAVKVYWSTGVQVLPPHDREIIDRVMGVGDIQQADFQEAVSRGAVVLCTDTVDESYFEQVIAQGFGGPRELKLIYSPLHGVGRSAVVPVLSRSGFTDVEVFGPQAEPDGDFPNVPNHVSNPENPRVFDAIIERARETGADLILATDPDCDRMGCAAPLTTAADAPWATMTGNQIGALLADYVLQQRQQKADLSPNHYLVKTLVTTEMIRRIGDAYGVATHGDLLVGFKWIGGLIDECGPDRFVFGAEESHGYLVGQYARDKDAPVACLLMAELAAGLKGTGKTIHEKLDDLYWQHGLHREQLLTIRMEGSEGMTRMEALMDRFRTAPPEQVGGIEIARVRDYLNQQTVERGQVSPLEGPRGNMVILDLVETGNSVAVRPSGTEPKVKFYTFAYTAPEQLADLDEAKERLQTRLDTFQKTVEEFAKQV